jgi:hypothetical protein
MSSPFQPVNSNPKDGELITLCKILEAVSTGNNGITLPAYNGVVLSDYAAADKPRSIVLKQNGTTVATLTLAYDGSNNLTSIVQS